MFFLLLYFWVRDLLQSQKDLREEKARDGPWSICKNAKLVSTPERKKQVQKSVYPHRIPWQDHAGAGKRWERLYSSSRVCGGIPEEPGVPMWANIGQAIRSGACGA